MSKNNVSSDFRKTDIDEFDENKFVDEDDGGENQGGPDEAEVDGFLRQYPYMASFFSFLFTFTQCRFEGSQQLMSQSGRILPGSFSGMGTGLGFAEFVGMFGKYYSLMLRLLFLLLMLVMFVFFRYPEVRDIRCVKKLSKQHFRVSPQSRVRSPSLHLSSDDLNRTPGSSIAVICRLS